MYSYNFPLSLTQTLCSDRTGWLWTGALSSFHTPSNTFRRTGYAHRTGHINLTQRNLNATVGGGGGGGGLRGPVEQLYWSYALFPVRTPR